MVILERRIERSPHSARSGRFGAVRRILARRPALWGGLAVAAVSYIGAGVPSYWGDEAASVLSAQRSWPSLLSELSTVDAVHGVYYALLHLWIDVFGSSEWSTRALSTIGIGFLAAGVVVLGRRWFDLRTGVLAGALIAIIPRAGVLAVEARGYALAAAAAVWTTVLLVTLARSGARRRAWIVYGIAVAVSGTFFLYLLLMPLVHLSYLLTAPDLERRRESLRRWVVSMLVAGVLAVPIAIAAELQKQQIAFLAHRSYMTPAGLFVSPWFGHLPVALVLWAVLLAGILAVALLRRRDRESAPAFWALLVWLVAPAVILATIDVAVSPTYNPRYLSFCLGAVAMFLAAGVFAILDAARAVGGPRGVAMVLVVLIGLGAATAVPEFVRERGPFAKDGGADGRAAAEILATQARPGETVLFGTQTRPSRAPRLVYRLYPEAFTGLRDPQLVQAAEDTDGLWDRLVSVAQVAPELGDGTVWLLESGDAGTANADRAALEAAGFTQVARIDVHRTVIYEFQRGTHS
ncbi:MAG: glycosyltransferase family 39 protein [Microbacterium sp.]|nr:glycosyltransferase family 39 protein [Microbacterium sp.]